MRMVNARDFFMTYLLFEKKNGKSEESAEKPTTNELLEIHFSRL